MSQYGPPNPPPEQQGPQQPGSYRWSSQSPQSVRTPITVGRLRMWQQANRVRYRCDP